MSKKDKLKREKPTKTKEQRVQEVATIMQKFNEFGLPIEHEALREFVKIAQGFADNGYAASGRLKLTGFSRNLVYLLSTQPHITSHIILENNPFA